MKQRCADIFNSLNLVVRNNFLTHTHTQCRLFLTKNILHIQALILFIFEGFLLLFHFRMSPFSERIINESSILPTGIGVALYSPYRNTPEEFIQKIQNMLKRLMLLFFLLLPALYGGAQEKRG